MSKKVAIVQSNYISWKGYFDLINLVDEFILYDDMQYTKRDWRNRNEIKTPKNLTWLTIPVKIKGKYFQKIKDVLSSDLRWNKRHWKSIVDNYAKAKHFSTYGKLFEDLYLGANEKFLSQVNYRFLTAICRIFNIGTKLSCSMDYRAYL